MSEHAARTAAELNLIGGFRFSLDGVPIDLAPAPMRLVAYLALQQHPATRSAASQLLWPDADRRHAGACLRSVLWRLSPLELVRSSSTHVWLNPEVEVDLRTLLDRTARLFGAFPSPEVLAAFSTDLLDAGDLLPGWDEEWVVPEREYFRQVRLQALDRISERLLECGRCFDALRVALAVVAGEPLRESAHRVVVKVHLAQGNLAEAVREYRRFAELLQVELGARPSRGMRDLLSPFLARAQLDLSGC